MKIAIIYSTSSKSTKKSCELLSSKINADVILIPIEKVKSECLLKYNFIILAGSAYYGKVQSSLKIFISRNIKTLMEKPTALVINCEDDIDTRERLNKTFTQELVDSSYISSNFGYELNPDEGNLLDKRKIKKIIDRYKKDGKNLPMLHVNEIDNFADYINSMIEKRVD